MRKIFLFDNVSLDGYFEGPGHDLSWARNDFEAFSAQESQDTDTLLLGHTTYDMFKSFWPTPQAEQVAPDVARFMNERCKIVVSRQLFDPGWNNASVISGEVIPKIRNLKEQPGGNIIILGSNTLVVSLMEEGLIDEFQVMVNPVAIGAGTPLFQGLARRVDLRLTETRPFKSGAVLLRYQPA